MWYNVIPPFVPLDPSLYPTYPTKTKGFDFLILKNYTCYVYGNVYPILKQPIVSPTCIPYFVGNQFPTMVQLMTNKDKQPVQQPVIAPIPTTVKVTTSLPTYVPRGSTHQPPNGRQFRDSLGRNSPEGNLLGEPPFNPLVGSYGWPTLDLHMFIPLWYQPPIVQPISKQTTKLPYRKLQYPTYVKDTNLDAHIRVFKKAIKFNGEIVETNIINLFGFT
jgi:hypothetical protein